MKLVCPTCGATASAEAWLNDAAIRYALDAIVQLPSPVLINILPYLGLFRKGKNSLPWAQALKHIRSLKSLIDEGTVHVKGGETRPCNASIWGAAMEATIDARPERLKGHNYLCQVAWDKAKELAAQVENAREEKRRNIQRNNEPREIPESARADIEKLKKKWGE